MAAITFQGFQKTMLGMKAILAMVLVQMVYACVNVLYKMAATDGMSPKVMVAYRGIFATAVMIPLALIFERKMKRPPLTWKILAQAFFCGLFGGPLSQNLSVESLTLTSATFATAMANLLPGMAFILALLFRLEKLKIRTHAGKAKVLGTLIGIGGAMLMTFYKGLELNLWQTNINLLKTSTATPAAHATRSQALGSLLAVGSCFCNAIWLILQSKMSQNYPGPFMNTALMSVMGSIQGVVYALWQEHDWVQWRLGWDIRLLTVAFVGICGTGVNITLITWCMSIRGPLFVSIFNPLMLVLVAFAGSMVLEEKLHVGSLLGGGLIVCGLYFVLWGKHKEGKEAQELPINSKELPNHTDALDIVIVPLEINPDQLGAHNIELNKENRKMFVSKVVPVTEVSTPQKTLSRTHSV